MPGRSLRRQLFGWVLIPLILLAAVNATLAWTTARGAANLVTDRMLAASARSIAEQTRFEDGQMQVSVPPAALEMFDTGSGDFVYYAVTTSDGRLVAGVADLPIAASDNSDREPATVEADFRQRRLRLLSLDHPLAAAASHHDAEVVVTVGTTLRSRDALLHHLWMLSFGQQLALILAAGLFMAFGLRRGLSPLLRLRRAVLNRAGDSLDPLDPGAVQIELQPLVTAINRQIARVRTQLAAQHRFVTNAAHQLRTPLTLLTVQAAYARRQSSAAEREEALAAIEDGAQQVSRLAGQLLTLARAEPGSRRQRLDRIDLRDLAIRVLDGFAAEALERRIDLGLEQRTEAVIRGDGTMLGELLTNLVDNALRYCPPGSTVTVRVDRRESMACLSVIDDGPGVPPTERDRLFERFYRVPGTAGAGSGLGLAIVKEIAEAAGGTAALRPRMTGLEIEALLPADDETADAPALAV